MELLPLPLPLQEMLPLARSLIVEAVVVGLAVAVTAVAVGSVAVGAGVTVGAC